MLFIFFTESYTATPTNPQTAQRCIHRPQGRFGGKNPKRTGACQEFS